MSSRQVALWRNPAFRTYIATGGFLALSIMMGFAGIGATRWLYMIGCIGLGYMAWKDSPGHHLEVTIILFAFTPFIRRVIDANAGFDMLGIMISGPLLTMLVPCVELRKFISGTARYDDTGLFLLAGACLVFGAMISLFNGDFDAIKVHFIKWSAPLL